MREIPCRDGSVALYDQDDDQDMVIVEPTVTSFAPVRGNARWKRGACAVWRPTRSSSAARAATASTGTLSSGPGCADGREDA